MQQIKIFIGQEDEKSQLEREVNDWIRQNNPRIVQVIGDMAPRALNRPPDASRVPGADPGTSRRYAPSEVLVLIVYDV